MSHISINDTRASHSSTDGQCKAVYISGILSEYIVLDGDGAIGDGHHGKDPERSIMLTSVLAYELAASHGIVLGDGELEENILVDIDPYSLPLGSQIEIGEAVLEIAKYGTICHSLTRIDNKLPKLLKEKRGIFAKVIRPGTIRSGDTIRVVEAQSYKKENV